MKGGPNSTQELINKEIAQSTLRNSWWKQKFSWNHKKNAAVLFNITFLNHWSCNFLWVTMSTKIIVHVIWNNLFFFVFYHFLIHFKLHRQNLIRIVRELHYKNNKYDYGKFWTMFSLICAAPHSAFLHGNSDLYPAYSGCLYNTHKKRWMEEFTKVLKIVRGWSSGLRQSKITRKYGRTRRNTCDTRLR